MKSYFGWAPTLTQSGVTLDRASLTHGGLRTVKDMLYLAVGVAIQLDCEWARIYERLVPLKCAYDERRRAYVGKKKVMGRIAGQLISMMYALLKQDTEALQQAGHGVDPPVTLYDPEIHHAHSTRQ